ncbi:MAG: glycerate kinase [Rhodobacteraceae bacterium]|nr:glycerate kinase [Paracoccaceae bacterium]
MRHTEKEFLKGLFDAAVAAADPVRVLPGFLPQTPRGRTVVVGAGKGAAQLAAAFERLWGREVAGTIVTPYGHAADCSGIRVLEAAHPVPDENGLIASRELIKAVTGLGPDDLVVALICGGSSALLPAPPKGLSLADEQDLNIALLNSGAPIGVMNAIRKCASEIKGGRLARIAHPAKVASLIVSDVPGDDPSEVGSGPTVPGTTGRAEAIEYVSAYQIPIPKRIEQHLLQAEDDISSPDESCFEGHEVRVIASAGMSLEAAAQLASDSGYAAVVLSDSIEGEAAQAGTVLAAIAREIANRDRPFRKPVVLLSGGETTVTIGGRSGRGGRNAEFLLSFALAIQGFDGIAALAADTDGKDGTEDNAGAFADGSTIARLRTTGMDARAALVAHDAWSAFDALGDLLVTGPTGTNVNDFRAMIIH